MNLKDNLKQIRKENNLSQEELAEKLGVSRQSVSKWERGEAYPEMDKMVQLCQMFNLNIDDLLNQNIKEVNNTKQAKNNFNKYIKDFLKYINKTVNMFSKMTFKSKIKCLIEQLFIIGILWLIFLIFGSILKSIYSNMLSFLSFDTYFVLGNIFDSILLILELIISLIIIFYIFKIRYLDYYEKIEEESIDSDFKESKNYNVEKEEKEKIIIRDSKESGERFINGLLKCFIYFLKFITIWISIVFCFSLIFFGTLLVLTFLFVKTGILFVGVLISLLSLIILNYVVLKVLFDFLFNHKSKKIRLALIFFSSLLFLGIGIGLSTIGFTKFNVIDSRSSKYFITEEMIIPMHEDLLLLNNYLNVNYIEEERDDLKFIFKHNKFTNIELDVNYNVIKPYINDLNAMESLRLVIKNLNENKIVLYDDYQINV